MDAPTPALMIEHPDDDEPPALTHQQTARVIGGIMLCIVLAAIDLAVVVPAVPAIAADLNGFGHLAWIVSAYLLTSTAVTPIYGKLSDIHGRRALLSISICLFIVTSVMCALSQSLWQLIIARGLQGIGGGGLMAMAQAVIADVVAPRERGRYQGYMAGSWAIASVCGPVVGGWLTDYLSWHWIFWINVPLGAAAWLLSHRALKLLKQHRQQARIDYLGAALLTGLITSFLMVMTWGGSTYAWDSAQILDMGGLSVLLLAGFAWQERRCADPLLPPRIFANPVIALGITTSSFTSAALLGGTFLLPLFFQLVRGVDAATSGSLLMPYLLMNACGAYMSGKLTRWLGRAKIVAILGLAGTVGGFGLLATMNAATGSMQSLSYVSFLGLSFGMAMPAIMVIVQNAAERRDIGSVTGGLLFLRSMGGAFGSTLVGALLIGRFTARLASLGLSGRVDLADLRGSATALQQLDAATRAAARTALESGFHLAFLACAAMCAVAWLASLATRDLPLRSSATQPAE
jgi:EmrB/QacA subfamily drug resistance transporter